MHIAAVTCVAFCIVFKSTSIGLFWFCVTNINNCRHTWKVDIKGAEIEPVKLTFLLKFLLLNPFVTSSFFSRQNLFY